jgi:hypothetical protein
MLFFGKGSIKVKEIPQIKTSITGTGMFTGVKETTGTNGETVLTSVSKDNAVTLKITQQKDGKESIATQIDTKKLDTSGINTTDLLHGNPAAIQAAKKLADKYIGTIVDPSDVTGMEAYLASNLLGQYKSNPDDMSISHTFGDTSLNLTGDTSTGIVNINIKQ